MSSQTSDVRDEISALSAIAEYLRNHVFDSKLDDQGKGSQKVREKMERLRSLTVLLALHPHETVYASLQNRLTGADGKSQLGVFAMMEEPCWMNDK